MNKKITSLAILTLLTACKAHAPSVDSELPPQTPPPIAVKRVETGIEKDELFQKDPIRYMSGNLSPQLLRADQNTVHSPASIFLALSVLSELDTTPEELRKFLGVNDWEQIRDFYHNFYKRNIEPQDEDSKMIVANSLWFTDTQELDDILRNNLEAYYNNTIMLQENFKNKNAVQKKIDEWISENTNNLISSIPLELDPNTSSVLINSIYLKDQFQDEFKENDDIEFKNDKQTKKVKALYSSKVDLLQSDNATMVKKRMRRTDMIFVQPKESQTLKDLLDSDNFRNILNDIKTDTPRTDVDATLTTPLIETEQTLSIIDDLKNLGLQKIFTENSGLRGFKNKNIAQIVSQIKHGTKFKMDKYGVEAAAYTAVEMIMKSAMMEPKEVINVVLDRPFLYFVVDKDNNPLFIGTYYNPQ